MSRLSLFRGSDTKAARRETKVRTLTINEKRSNNPDDLKLSDKEARQGREEGRARDFSARRASPSLDLRSLVAFAARRLPIQRRNLNVNGAIIK